MTKEKAILILKNEMMDCECDECLASEDDNYNPDYMREVCEHREALAMAIKSLGGKTE